MSINVFLFPAGVLLGMLAMLIPYCEVKGYLREERCRSDRWRTRYEELAQELDVEDVSGHE